jgi:hypothetical protein
MVVPMRAERTRRTRRLTVGEFRCRGFVSRPSNASVVGWVLATALLLSHDTALVFSLVSSPAAG